MEKKQTCPLCGCTQVTIQPVRHDAYGWCPVCSGVFMDRDLLPDPERERSEYLLHNNDVEDPRYQNFARPLVDLVSSLQESSQRGLDFGAGTGPVITKMLKERGYTLSLYDPFFHPDRDVLEVSYDYMIACEVIEHFHNPAREFALLSRLLKTGGRLYCRTSLLNEETDFASWRYRQDITHVFFYTEKTLRWIADQLLKCSCTIIDRNLFYFMK